MLSLDALGFGLVSGLCYYPNLLEPWPFVHGRRHASEYRRIGRHSVKMLCHGSAAVFLSPLFLASLSLRRTGLIILRLRLRSKPVEAFAQVDVTIQ